jgi:hypothetical protein
MAGAAQQPARSAMAEMGAMALVAILAAAAAAVRMVAPMDLVRPAALGARAEPAPMVGGPAARAEQHRTEMPPPEARVLNSMRVMAPAAGVEAPAAIARNYRRAVMVAYMAAAAARDMSLVMGTAPKELSSSITHPPARARIQIFFQCFHEAVMLKDLLAKLFGVYDASNEPCEIPVLPERFTIQKRIELLRDAHGYWDGQNRPEICADILAEIRQLSKMRPDAEFIPGVTITQLERGRLVDEI